MESKKKLENAALVSVILVFLFLIFFSSTASAKEITVNNDAKAGFTDFASIQEAVKNSVPGDVIIVSPGMYNETVNVSIQNISIISESKNPQDTIIKGFEINKNNIVISGFTLQEYVTIGGSIFSNQYYSPLIENSTIRNNRFLKGGIDATNCFNSSFEKNTFFGKASGIDSEFYNSNFSDNIFFEGNLSIHAYEESTNNLILNNTFFKGGIGLAGSSDNKILKNKISKGFDNGYGIVLFESHNNIIDNNSISDTICGILLPFICSSNKITNNTLVSNNEGIKIDHLSSRNTLKNNTITKNNVGILILNSCPYTLITGNRIELNKDYGIYLKQSSTDPSFEETNLVYNNFFNNTINFFNNTKEMQYGEPIFTFWNITRTSGTNLVDGQHLGGNYWAKPDGTGFSETCTDINNDGICDLPYNINRTDFDYLPLSISRQNIDDNLTIKEIQIVNNESAQQSPVIYGDNIIWLDWRNGNQDIYMYSFPKSRELQVSSNSSSYFTNSPVYEDRIVWVDSPNGNDNIFMYNISTSKQTQLTNNKSSKGSPAIYEDRIVWADFRNGGEYNQNSDIYMYNISTSRETQITTNEAAQAEPAIYRDNIVWLDSRNGHRDIYLYNLSTNKETQVTFNKSVLEPVVIYNDRLVWTAWEENGYDIVMYNITTQKQKQITTNNSEQHDPAIYGDLIVWTDYRNLVETKFPVDVPTPDIYMYNLLTSKETRITTSGSARNPSIYENKVVWEDWRNADSTGENSDIYMCILPEEGLEPTIPVVNFTSNVTRGYLPLFVKFEDSSEKVKEWNWDFGDGTGSVERNPVHIYSSAGIYTVKLTANNKYGSASKTTKITVMKEHKGNGGSNHQSISRSSGKTGGTNIPKEPAKNIEVKETFQTFVTKEKSAKFNFPKSATSVVYVSFDSNRTFGKTTALVEMLKGKSALVSERPSGQIYRFFNIWLDNNRISIADNIENTIVCFKVEKSWIENKKVDPSSIILNRYNNRKWDQLPTSLLAEENMEDEKYLYFTAKTPGFSPFAITGKITTPKSNDSIVQSDLNNNVGTVAEQEPVKKESTDTSTSGFGIVCGILCFIALFLVSKDKKE
ncbi:MAG: PGF-pre-PGF domain-containing protein [Methanosarcina sp.]